MELAVAVELVLFGYMVYATLQLPSDFSSLVIVNPRKKVDPNKASVKKEAVPAPRPAAMHAAAPAIKAPPPPAAMHAAAPVVKAPPPPAAPAEPVVKKEEPSMAKLEEPAKAAVEPPAAEPAQAPREAYLVTMLKNPATGEIAPLPADYRFAKKWIKDALVSEGLLDRIYKNSDLDRKNRTRIREALERLKAMPKYSV
jgi:hypothetical protein